MRVYYLERVPIPDLNKMITAVLNSCRFYLQGYDKSLTKQYVLKNYIEYRLGLNNYAYDSDFYDLVKKNYFLSSNVKLENGKWVFSGSNRSLFFGAEISSMVHNGIPFKLIRDADYGITNSEERVVFISREETLEFMESKIGIKQYKIFLLDTKYINGFWDDHPDGLISIGKDKSRLMVDFD
jgi:hypothetical protein